MKDILQLAEQFKYIIDVAKCKCYDKDKILEINKIEDELKGKIEAATSKTTQSTQEASKIALQ